MEVGSKKILLRWNALTMCGGSLERFEDEQMKSCSIIDDSIIEYMIDRDITNITPLFLERYRFPGAYFVR